MLKQFIAATCTAAMLTCTAVPAYAWYTIGADRTTVQSISNDTSEAEQLLESNVGTPASEYTIPGLVQTVSCLSNGTIEDCDHMAPQGICYANGGEYMLISAYCTDGRHASVVYVLDGSTKSYLTTLILADSFINDVDGKATTVHAGGVACDGSRLWIANSDQRELWTYDASVLSDCSSSRSYIMVNHNGEYNVFESRSNICLNDYSKTHEEPAYVYYWNGYLYEGEFDKSATTFNVYRYYVGSGESFDYAGYFTVNGIVKAQGIAVRDNRLVITTSYGRKKENLSDMYVFNLPEDASMIDSVDASSAIHYTLPPMAEGCYIGYSAVWVIFESGSTKYLKGKLPGDQVMSYDKFVSFNYDTVGLQ